MSKLVVLLCLITISLNSLVTCSKQDESYFKGVRKKREAEEPLILGLTQEQHDESLEQHNYYRRLIKASNMEKMRYNTALAEMAYNLTESCYMRHWWPATWPNQPFITYDTGQNLYAGSSATLNLTRAVRLWYNEIDVYDYETNKCTKSQCGHFTQLVWGDSYLVGCAHTYCAEFMRPDKSMTSNFHFYACNYGHAGNVQGRKPWKEGPACTGCDSGYFWCDNEEPRGLCVSKYNGSVSVPGGITCTEGGCLNGGVLGCDCKCNCTDKNQGKFCQDSCPTDPRCGKELPVSYCKDYPSPMLTTCPALCGLCGQPNPEACPEVTTMALVTSTMEWPDGDSTSPMDNEKTVGETTTLTVTQQKSESTVGDTTTLTVTQQKPESTVGETTTLTVTQQKPESTVGPTTQRGGSSSATSITKGNSGSTSANGGITPTNADVFSTDLTREIGYGSTPGGVANLASVQLSTMLVAILIQYMVVKRYLTL